MPRQSVKWSVREHERRRQQLRMLEEEVKALRAATEVYAERRKHLDVLAARRAFVRAKLEEQALFLRRYGVEAITAPPPPIAKRSGRRKSR